MTQSHVKHILLWAASIVGVLLVLLVGAIFFASDTLVRTVLGSKASSNLGREVSVQAVKIDWDWTTPQIHLSQIAIGNLPQSKDAHMVAIDDVDFHIRIWKLLEGQLNLPDISLTRPTVILEKFDETTKNWDFPALSKASAVTSAALPSHRGNFPMIGALRITDGKLTYRDKTKNLDLTLVINTAEGGGAQGDLTLAGDGTLAGKPFTIRAQGGSLDMLRNSTEKYPLHLKIQMGPTMADIDGTFVDPVQMEGIDTRLSLQGDSLADLFYLTLLPLPPTPTYKLSGHLIKKESIWSFENFTGKVGNSDLEGTLDYDTSKQRGVMKAALTSKMLDMKDLAGFLGATPMPRPNEKSSAAQLARAQQEAASPKLIPDIPIDLTRLRTTDLDVTLKSDRILASSVPMDNIFIHFNLQNGVLKLDPLEFGMANGKIAGSLTLDGGKDVPHVESYLTLTRLSLKQFFENTRFAPLSTGYIGGRFELKGDGKSLADVLGDSSGRITFLMSGGTVSQLLVDAAGLDIGKATPILLGKDKAAGIRCAVSDFNVNGGLLKSQIFVFDTTISNIAGTASVNLKDETIDAKIEAQPKSVTITAHAPILITGPIKHPAVTVDLKDDSARIAGATVLAVFLTPIAAIVPFIEAGLGKDSDCQSLIEQARAYVPQPPATAKP